MLTYTFSKREKFLVTTLGILLLALMWYKFVYITTTDQTRELETQLERVEANIVTSQTKLAHKRQMERSIEQHKAAGDKQTPIPDYDNIKPLMAELDSIMAKTDSYTLAFDALDRESSEYVLRGVGMQFGCDTYAAAEKVVRSIADGKYPCIIDAVDITTTNATVRARTRIDSKVRASIHVVFYENPTTPQAAQP